MALFCVLCGLFDSIHVYVFFIEEVLNGRARIHYFIGLDLMQLGHHALDFSCSLLLYTSLDTFQLKGGCCQVRVQCLICLFFMLLGQTHALGAIKMLLVQYSVMNH